MKENEITAKIQEYLKTVDGCFFWKEHSGVYGTGGIPDIICCLNGKFIALEVKTEKGKVSVLQQVTLRRIRKAGGIAEVVRSVGDALKIIEKVR